MKRDRTRPRGKLTLKQRRWAYGVLTALGGVALTYGIAEPDQVASLLVLGAALLGVAGVAVAHPTEE